jgi:hypothetical protein
VNYISMAFTALAGTLETVGRVPWQDRRGSAHRALPAGVGCTDAAARTACSIPPFLGESGSDDRQAFLWVVAKQRGHSITTMLSVYAAWTERATETDIKAIKRAVASPRWSEQAAIAQATAMGPPQVDSRAFAPVLSPGIGGSIEAALSSSFANGYATRHRQQRSQMLEKTGNNWRRERDSNPAEGRMKSISY